MRENRPYGSEGGEAQSLPDLYRRRDCASTRTKHALANSLPFDALRGGCHAVTYRLDAHAMTRRGRGSRTGRFRKVGVIVGRSEMGSRRRRCGHRQHGCTQSACKADHHGSPLFYMASTGGERLNIGRALVENGSPDIEI
jgi:hypothetical protein